MRAGHYDGGRRVSSQASLSFQADVDVVTRHQSSLEEVHTKYNG